MISEKQVERALEILIDREGESAKARAAHEYLQDMDRVLLAKLGQECNEKSAAAKDAYARAHPDYAAHLEHKRAVAETDYRFRDKKAAASAIIDLYRTEQSNARAAVKLT